MKLTRKYYPIACILCFIMVIGFSAIHAYKPPKKEGFLENINVSKNEWKRKGKIFKEDITKITDEGFRAVKKLLR